MIIPCAAFATVQWLISYTPAAEEGRFTCRQSKLKPEKALTEQSLQQLMTRDDVKCYLPTCKLCERIHMMTKSFAKAWEII